MEHVQSIVQGLRATPALLEEMVRAIPISRLHERRGEGFWTIAEHTAHLADVQPMLTKRLKRILAEDTPAFVPFIPDDGDPPTTLPPPDVDAALGVFADERAAQTALLAAQDSAAWARLAVHPEYDQYGLYVLARHMLMHDHWHMYRMEELWLTRDAWLAP
ncbi:MAG: DinB family protein [Desulfovibrionaceae bacterium]